MGGVHHGPVQVFSFYFPLTVQGLGTALQQMRFKKGNCGRVLCASL